LTLFENSADPVFALDANDRIVFVNPAWEALTGHSGEAVAGLECRPPDRAPDGSHETIASGFCPPVEVRQGEPASTTVLVVRPSGERIWRRVEFWPLLDQAARKIGLLGVVSSHDAGHHLPEGKSQRLRTDLLALREELRSKHALVDLIGQGPAHRRLLGQIATAASTSIPVLIVGEPGTGKRLVARAIHGKSDRSLGPFLHLDATALSPDDLANELFPREPADLPPGLATGESATLVLGDLQDLPRDIQARLAEALASTRPPAARLIVTTAGNVEVHVREGRLRPDLYYAVTGLVIHLEPLRDRLDDVSLLAQHFLELANGPLPIRKQGFSAPALEVLRSYDWPGNVAELRRVVEAAAARAQHDLITPADLPPSIQGHLGAAYNPPPMPAPLTPLDQTLEQVEKRLIERALQLARQKKSRAAELLEISRPRLYRRMKELGVADLPEPGDDAATDRNHA
jgi:PAS domain S-box-containing protein